MNPTKELRRIQENLNTVYESYHSQNSDFSFRSLAARIEEHWEELNQQEIDLLPLECRGKPISLQESDNFRKFVKGESHLMKPAEKLWASFLWLTSDDCEYSSLTSSDIGGGEYHLKLAQLFERFLYDNNQVETWLTTESLCHRYVFSNERSTFGLVFQGRIGSNILRATQHEERYVGTDVELIFSSGFLVFTPEDRGILLLRNEHELFSTIYTLLPNHEVKEPGEVIEEFTLVNLEGSEFTTFVSSQVSSPGYLEEEEMNDAPSTFPLYRRIN